MDQCKALVSSIEKFWCAILVDVTEHRGARQIALTGLRFLIHFVVAAIGVPVVASVLRYSILLSVQEFDPSFSLRVGRQMQWILLQTPYFPVQIIIGLLMGFRIGRHFRELVMLWTWTVPALTIILLILFAPFPPVIAPGVEISKLQHFFGWRCLPQNHCFEQVGLTLPFYSACAYSLGAFLTRIVPPLRTAAPKDAPQTASRS
jgi:hypothetical protein